MKKVVFLLSIIITNSISIYSQGNLQFNKVINIQSNWLWSAYDTVITVPINKVWKIESAGFQEKSKPINGCQIKLYLENYFLFGSQSDLTNTALALFSNFPIWLSNGTYRLFVSYVNCNSNPPIKPSLSIIEFNIVP